MRTIYTINVNCNKLFDYVSSKHENFDAKKGLVSYYKFISDIKNGKTLEELLTNSKHPYKLFIEDYNNNLKELRKKSDNKDYYKDENGNITWIGSNYMAESDYKGVFKKHYDLFIDIRDNGMSENVSIRYMKQHLGTDNFIFEGWHRATIAMLLGYKEIAVDFITDCEELIELCDLAFKIYKEKLSVYQPIEHPFFKFIKVHSNSEEKLPKIKELMNKINADKKLPILDFGCLSGFYVRNLTSEGYSVTGVEYEKNFYRMSQLVLKILGKSGDMRFGPVQNFIKDWSKESILMSLSFFHHWFKTKDFYDYLTNTMMPWIKKNVKHMIVDIIEFKDETQMFNAHVQYTQEQVLDYYVKNGGFTSYEEIDAKWDSRRLFLLSK